MADATVTALRRELRREFALAEVKHALAAEFLALLPAFFTKSNKGRKRGADENPAG